jgi:hypothetical protein
MLNFLKFREGSVPGKKRKSSPPPTVSSEKKKQQQRLYEKERERVFNRNWQLGRDWLQYDDKEKKMSCAVCIDHYGKDQVTSQRGQNLFILGSQNFRKSAVDDHEMSKNHVKAMAKKNASTSGMSKSEGGRALLALKDVDRKRLSILIRSAHAVAKQNRPITDYQWLCKLDKCKGLAVGETYQNNKACLKFIETIAVTVQESTINLCDHAKFISFMMDGTTDISGDEQETIYIRTAQQGQVFTRFLAIGSPKSTCSDQLYEHVLETFKNTGIDGYVEQGKMVGFGSDGASNMTGVNTGLTTQLKNDYPEMISVHCLCHRLELAFKDAIKIKKNKKKVNMNQYDKMMTLLIGLHYMYKRSSKQKGGLMRSMEALHVKGTLPPKATGTRWLPHLSRGIDSLIRTFRAYVAHLSTASHDNAKAEGLVKIMLTKEVMAFILVLQVS